ncbi:MAG: serine hydrolase [Capsulimonadales bacterium]|nr:serine hydrolase [Capsulimonadales bacterium]
MGNAGEWQKASPEAVGVDSARLERMTEVIRQTPDWRIHALLIEKDHRLIYETYLSGVDEKWGDPLGMVDFGPDVRHDLRSITKSVVSALVGVALNSGAIPSLDMPLIDAFPEYADLRTDERLRIRLRHALSMTAGLDWNEEVPYSDPANDEIAMTFSPEPLRYVLSRPIVADPGVGFRYNGGLTQVLAAILQRGTGIALSDYAEKVLFGPLGISEYEWLGDIDGMPAAASGLRLSAHDLARFASLYLHGGEWEGKTVVPADWVAASTQRQFAFDEAGTSGYGYQWWYGQAETPSGETVVVPRAIGNGEQRIFLLPTRNAAVTILAGRYNDFSFSPTEQILREHLVPALYA